MKRFIHKRGQQGRGSKGGMWGRPGAGMVAAPWTRQSPRCRHLHVPAASPAGMSVFQGNSRGWPSAAPEPTGREVTFVPRARVLARVSALSQLPAGVIRALPGAPSLSAPPRRPLPKTSILHLTSSPRPPPPRDAKGCHQAANEWLRLLRKRYYNFISLYCSIKH